MIHLLLQYARAAQWPLDREPLNLMEEPLIDLDGFDSTVSIWQAPPQHLKLFFTVNQHLYRFRADREQFSKLLIQGILGGDVGLTARAFDEVFGVLPALIGHS